MILLSSTARLKWDDNDATCWQERWFRLGARSQKGADAVEAFWQSVAAACVKALCHTAAPDTPSPDEAAQVLKIPLPEAAGYWLETSPPLPGGEYLTLNVLRTLWEALLAWCAARISEYGGVAPFLQHLAPHWRHVGRVFFHLAENKMDALHPFAFLATYVTGLNDRQRPRHVPLAHALRQYASAQDKPALLRLLEPVHRAAEHLQWVQEMVSNGTIYHPTPWTPDRAYGFLKSVEDLEASGIGVRLPDWWKKRARPQVKAVIDMRKPAGLGAKELLHVDVRVAIGEEQCTDTELAELLAQPGDGLVLFKDQWIEVDRGKLRQALRHWQVASEQASAGTLTFIQGMRLLAGFPSETNDSTEEESIRQWSLPQAGEGFRELLAATRSQTHEICGDIPGLQATLRPYQTHGVAWLSFLGKLGLGACLADDMGLGKTMQILALLLHEKQERANHDGPSLLIAPTSLLGNWMDEAARFAPQLSLALLHGSAMSKEAMEHCAAPGALEKYDLVLTSYTTCSRLPWLAQLSWKRVIIDEAQAIKNAGTRQSRAIRALTASSRIAMTGTPIENSLADLWALFDFLNPGLLGSAKGFSRLVKKMELSQERFAPLRRITAPYILRRLKTDRTVIDSLPDKTEVPLHCYLTKEQAGLYVQVTEKLKEALEELHSSPETVNPKRRMVILQSLMLLKQICNHPAQAGQHGGQAGGQDPYAPERSGKFQCVGALCETIAARQEKLLLFTQFREIVEPLARYLTTVFHTTGLVLHGGVPVKKRQSVVEAFQSPDGPPFLVLTLKVGGTGLTLTAANHVIHFDRWWNPAVEDQATDRAFRIGQKRNVLVHTCLTKGTLEEKIDALIASKRKLAEEILGQRSEVDISSMSDEEIWNFVRLDAEHMME